MMFYYVMTGITVKIYSRKIDEVSGHNLNNIRDSSVMMAGRERNHQRILEKLLKEISRKVLTTKCKLDECTAVNTRYNSICDDQIGEVKIRQVQKFSHTGNVLIDSGKYETETRRWIGIAENSF